MPKRDRSSRSTTPAGLSTPIEQQSVSPAHGEEEEEEEEDHAFIVPPVAFPVSVFPLLDDSPFAFSPSLPPSSSSSAYGPQAQIPPPAKILRKADGTLGEGPREEEEDTQLCLDEVLLQPEEKSLRERDAELFMELHYGRQTASPTGSAGSRSKRSSLTGGSSSSVGEQRLKINFLDYGRVGASQQTVVYRVQGGFSIIPDGLVGLNEVYGEPWMFEIHHRRPDHFKRTVLELSITNLHTNRKVTRMETEEEAFVRESQSKTICNQVLKLAMESRAQEYEEMLRQTPADDAVRRANLESRIRSLRPKRLLIGPLFFGLQHLSVQEQMNAALQLSTSSAGTAPVKGTGAPPGRS